MEAAQSLRILHIDASPFQVVNLLKVCSLQGVDLHLPLAVVISLYIHLLTVSARHGAFTQFINLDDGQPKKQPRTLADPLSNLQVHDELILWHGVLGGWGSEWRERSYNIYLQAS